MFFRTVFENTHPDLYWKGMVLLQKSFRNFYYHEAMRMHLLTGFGPDIYGASLVLFRPTAIEITYLATNPAYRKMGYGKRLMFLLHDNYEDSKKAFFQLSVRANNHGARHLYESLAYKYTQYVSDMYGKGEHGFLMSRPISSIV